MAGIAYKREERKEQVVLAFKVRYANVGLSGMTMRRIAQKLDMRPSNFLMKILMEMVEEGILEVKEFEHRPNMIGREFNLKEGSYQMPGRLERMVKFAVGGIEQQELKL